MVIQNKRLSVILFTGILILLVPLVAMPFTNEVNWELSDFIIAGILLFGTGFVLELIFRTVRKKKMRIAISVILIIIFLLIWAELAVGIFGTPLAGS